MFPIKIKNKAEKVVKACLKKKIHQKFFLVDMLRIQIYLKKKCLVFQKKN